MNFDLIIEILGFSVGLLYLWWEYHADNRMWFASMVMPFISMWIYFNKGLYADFAINIYYLVIAVYGYIVWTSRRRAAAGVVGLESMGKDAAPMKQDAEGLNQDAESMAADVESPAKKELPITRIPLRMAAVCAVAAIALWVLLYLGLNYLTDSTVPVADAFTTAMSIVGMWMLARKHLEQWIVWIAVDAVCVGLYIYKGIYFYAALYLIYTIIAFFGYRKWRRLMPTPA